ncbi:hypothetical protein FTV88_0122 [Heliorestis convoluta]|uniref:Uncharacterized protein n=1 Tax=Heliorestis convoluta TaxID=356322 RepID=A0A5Q2MX16_9FIRM|nr:hypothetical protein FTV88_0122 [Heliorestis convoluta]
MVFEKEIDFEQALSPSVAVHPLRPATDRRHGRLLLHHLANRTRTHLLADCSFGCP